MTLFPKSALVRVISSGLTGRVWCRYHKPGQRIAYLYCVRLDGGQEVEVGSDDLEVTL